MNERLHNLLDHSHLRHLNRLVLLRQHGSYTAAGAVLDLPAASIKHSIVELGLALGVEIRRPYSRDAHNAPAVLTEAGAKLADDLAPLLGSICKALAAAAQNKPTIS